MPNLQDITIPELPARNSSLRKVDASECGSSSIGDRPAPVRALLPPLGSDAAARCHSRGLLSARGWGLAWVCLCVHIKHTLTRIRV